MTLKNIRPVIMRIFTQKGIKMIRKDTDNKMNNEERYAESYKITQAIHIGTSEIVIGIDMKAKDNMYYMVADYENNGIFEKYNNALVSDSYTEILSIFTERINNGLAKIK